MALFAKAGCAKYKCSTLHVQIHKYVYEDVLTRVTTSDGVGAIELGRRAGKGVRHVD
jgi:hypothetical protein